MAKDSAKRIGKAKGQGWKAKQQAKGVKRDVQIDTMLKMISVLASDVVRLSLRHGVVEDVLAKRCGVTTTDFDASAAAVSEAMKIKSAPVNLLEGQVAGQTDLFFDGERPVALPEGAVPLAV